MKHLFAIGLLIVMHSCSDTTTKKDLVTLTKDGTEVNKSDTLSVEDILLLQSEAKGPWLSYKAILANDIEKEHVFELGDDESAECYIISNKKNVKLTIAKLSEKKKKQKQRILTQKVFFYKNDSTENTIYNKKKSMYKATLALKHRIREDSSVNVQLDIYKVKNK